MNKLFVFLTLILSLSLTLAWSGEQPVRNIGDNPEMVRQAFMERSPGTFDPAAYLKNQQETFHWLKAEAVSLSPETIVTVRVTPADLEGIENYQCEACTGTTYKVRIGVSKPVGLRVSFRDLGPSSLARTAEGGYVWTRVVESPGATALRLHFSDFSLPPHAELYIYNLDGEAFGPYRGFGPANDGEFWSNTVSGPVMFLQLRHYGTPTPADLKATSFVLKDVGYLGEKFLLPFMQQIREYTGNLSSTLSLCSYNEPCVEDASCYSGTAINDAKYAVAHMEWISGAWIYYCSGGLVADTVADAPIPYFLSANHCISKNKDAKNLECFWQYWTASCGGACYDPVGAVPRTLGADVLSSGKTGDYTLMQLWEDPPAGSVFMGWTSAPVAFSDGDMLFRISHPSGAPQAYSTHQVDADAPTCSSWPRGSWIYSRDVIGATEGGSSGSPVYNLSGQIVGQLTGACGTNVNEICDNVNNATVDGAFASYYDTVKQWLDPTSGPGGTMHVHAIDLSLQIKGVNYTCYAAVTIVDESDNPVEGAVVYGTFTGDVSDTVSGTTDASGVAALSTKKKGTVTTFTFTVDNVTHSSYTYNPGANVETQDTY